jgi:stage V sporulation protein B
MLTAAALIGIPNSVSKLVAEELALKEYNKAHETFRIAFIITGTLGFIISILLFAFSHTILSVFIKEEGSYYALIGLSMAPFFIAIAGAIRGYLQGMQIMYPTAISQVIENVFKVVIGIGLVVIILNNTGSIPKAVGGASLGVSVGLIISALFLTYVYMSKRDEIKENIKNNDAKVKYSRKAIAKKIAYIAVPITIASASYSILLFIDALTLPRMLAQKLMYENSYVAEGTVILGILSKGQTIINVPLVISVSLIISIVPAISAANVLKNKAELVSKIKEAIQMAIKLALPSAVGILVLADPILTFIYREPEGSDYLRYLAVSLFFMIFAQSLIGILQGLSMYYAPLIIVIVASVSKVVANVAFINSTTKGYGSLVGTITFYIVITVLSYIMIKREVAFKQSFYHAFGKPLIASGIMGIITYLSYSIVYNLVGSNALSVLVAVTIGISSYAIVMVFLKAFTKDEIMILPKHNKIIAWLDKHKLIKE